MSPLSRLIEVFVISVIDPLTPWEDQCEWHRMTSTTGPDCTFMCNLINTHYVISIIDPLIPLGRINAGGIA